MGLNDLFSKGKQLFDDGKEKVTDFVESEKGEQLIDRSKKIFEDGKEKVTDLVESEKGQQFIDHGKSLFEDGKEKVTGLFEGDNGAEAAGQLSDAASDSVVNASADEPSSTTDDLRRPLDPAAANP